jgi:hypothetical protein
MLSCDPRAPLRREGRAKVAYIACFVSAAEILGLPASTLRARMKKLGLK